MVVTAIVLAAGKSSRLKSKISKPLIKINSQPAIIYCLLTLSQHSLIKDIIVVANSKNKKNILNNIREYRIPKVKGVVLGGRLRQDSVNSGLGAMNNNTDLVLIHDAARPFIKEEVLFRVINTAKIYGAAIVGVPVKATIKGVKVSRCQSVKKEFIVEETLDRDRLWEIQTPQVFKKDLILEAYKDFGDTEVTDDASLVEKLGTKVRVVMGSYSNIKITTPEDLIVAEAVAKSSWRYRVTRVIGFKKAKLK